MELTDRISTTNVSPNTKLFSFDIKNMYSNIPVNESINIISEKLKHQNIDKTYINQMEHSLNTILNRNYFESEGKIYKRTDGLAMGSPLSSIISEIYLQTIDENVLTIIKTHDEKGEWFRYVDDGLYISQNNGIRIEQTKKEINEINQKLCFSIEEEHNSKLNYLDITIGYNHNKTQFQMTIYRKPTQTSSTIPVSSNHPPSHKMAAYNAFIYRMFEGD